MVIAELQPNVDYPEKVRIRGYTMTKAHIKLQVPYTHLPVPGTVSV
jgi:hypothetical protein